MLLDVSRNLLEADSFGYRILAGQQSAFRRLELGAFLQTGVGQFGIEAADAFGQRSTRAYAGQLHMPVTRFPLSAWQA